MFIATLPSAAIAQQTQQQCFDQAEAEYIREMDRCLGTSRNQYNVWNERVDSDFCLYGAGLTYDGARRDCYIGYPDETSQRDPVIGRKNDEYLG